MNALKREPALISGFVAAVIALLLAFGLKLDNNQVGAIMGVVSVVMAVITRQQVTPVADPRLDPPQNGGLVP